MLFQPPMHHQNKGEVCFYPVISIFIGIICTHFLCVYFIYLHLFTNTWPILDSKGLGALFGAYFLEKRAFYLLTLPKQMSFLTISNKIISFKTQGNRLGVIVAPNKCLVQALE